MRMHDWLTFARKNKPGPDGRHLSATFNQRRHGRIPFCSAVSICWTEVGGEHNRAIANAIDISTYGMLVEIAEPVPLGAQVSIIVKDFDYDGPARVVHRRRYRKHFRLGLQFSSALVFYVEVKRAMRTEPAKQLTRTRGSIARTLILKLQSRSRARKQKNLTN
jgi:PilZ domain